MLSKHHFEISLFSNFILFDWLIFQNIIGFVAITCGVFIGCLLPDTDLPKSKIDYMEGITGFFGMISKNILNPLVAAIFESYLKKSIDRGHRGITHTVYGILMYCVLIEGISLPILFFLGFGTSIIMYSLFVFGLFLGGIFHLMEDSCTITGILPFYPLNSIKKYSGKISTYNMADIRPKYFSRSLLFIAVSLLIIQVYLKSDIVVNILSSIGIFLLSWIVIILISRI
jgi:membrane-bound metal-dependent hydrolase YbcI (DUF457 family)